MWSLKVFRKENRFQIILLFSPTCDYPASDTLTTLSLVKVRVDRVKRRNMALETQIPLKFDFIRGGVLLSFKRLSETSFGTETPRIFREKDPSSIRRGEGKEENYE